MLMMACLLLVVQAAAAECSCKLRCRACPWSLMLYLHTLLDSAAQGIFQPLYVSNDVWAASAQTA